MISNVKVTTEDDNEKAIEGLVSEPHKHNSLRPSVIQGGSEL